MAVMVWLATPSTSLRADPPTAVTLVPPPTPLPPQAQEITLENAAALLAAGKNLHILDIRTLEEYKQIGFIRGAIHFDYFQMLPDCGPQLTGLGLDVNTPCLVYCAMGERSHRAANLLAKAGYQHILILKGGFDAWKAKGLPIEKDR